MHIKQRDWISNFWSVFVCLAGTHDLQDLSSTTRDWTWPWQWKLGVLTIGFPWPWRSCSLQYSSAQHGGLTHRLVSQWRHEWTNGTTSDCCQFPGFGDTDIRKSHNKPFVKNSPASTCGDHPVGTKRCSRVELATRTLFDGGSVLGLCCLV